MTREQIHHLLDEALDGGNEAVVVGSLLAMVGRRDPMAALRHAIGGGAPPPAPPPRDSTVVDADFRVVDDVPASG